MIIDYDHNPSLTVDQKLQSLKESVQMALNELEANNAPEQKNSLAKTIIEDYVGSTLAGTAQSVQSAIDAVASRFSSYVPTSRKVNNKALTSDITLTASDVNALADSASAVTATKVGNYYSGSGITAMKNGGCVTVNISFVASASFTSRTTVATIPAGYRPMGTTFGYRNGTTEYFVIESNGDVKFNSLTSGSTYYGAATYCKA